MDPYTSVAAAAGGISGIIAAIFSYRSSVRAAKVTEEANRISGTKVDAEAYERSQKFYESLLNEAEKHIDRLRSQTDKLNDQVDRLSAQLANEQDVSNSLRNQVRGLTVQIGSMELTLNDLSANIGRPHVSRT